VINFNGNFSRNILFRLVILLVLAGAIMAYNLELLNQIYFRNQLTSTGLVINSAIFGLFLLGLGKILISLLRYRREEGSLIEFIAAVDDGLTKPQNVVEKDSLIGKRFRALESLNRLNAPINHSALASILLADESTRLSFPRFINNILILTGVFGTIVSLSIALIGASNLLDGAHETGSMGMVIHGMSTALSTTITAIICFLFYGYFYLKLTDSQTHMLSGVEQVTSLYLMPHFANNPDTLLQNATGLMHSLRQVADEMKVLQGSFRQSSTELRDMLALMNERILPMDESVGEIKQLLREGFRLPEKSE
jgi:hypothetical protein